MIGRDEIDRPSISIADCQDSLGGCHKYLFCPPAVNFMGLVGIFLAGSYRFWTVVILNCLEKVLHLGKAQDRTFRSQLSTLNLFGTTFPDYPSRLVKT
jgi:hypothetical protein